MRGEDAARVDQAVDVVGRRLPPDEQHGLSLATARLGEVRVEHDRAGRRSRGCVEPRRDHVDGRVRIDHRVEQLVELTRVDARDGLLARDEVFLGHLGGDPERGPRRPLPRPGLEQEERPLLDGELDVLHLAVVLLEPLERRGEACVGVREQLAHVLDRLRRPDTGHDVLSLSVDEELAVEAPLAGRRVAREADARAGRVPLVAEHHLDDVHGRAELVGDVVRAAVDAGTRRLPRVEHGPGRAAQLLPCVRGERRPRLALVELLEGRDQRAEVVRGQLDVEARAARLLERLQLALEDVRGDAVDHLPVHLDEASIGVEREPQVARRGRQPLDRDVVEPEVEDRVHHPGHRDRRSRADRDEERVAGVAEALPRLLLEPRDLLVDLGPERLGHVARVHRLAARVGRDREAGRNRDPERRHLRKADALAAEQLPPARGLLVECVDQAHGAILRTVRDSVAH